MLPSRTQTLPVPSPVTSSKSLQHRYKAPLPPTCISFCSDEGKQIFKEALATSYMQGYFRLAAHFSTQSEPAFCGLSTLATVLNALQVDPHCLWKGPWRWYDESVFDCCIDLQDARRQGITLSEFVSLAGCNGLDVMCYRPLPANIDSGDGVEAFRNAVRHASARDDTPLVVSYSRAVLQQTGDGHFSTIAGYHEARDLALVLDTARFKYLPYWVPVSMLYEAMKPVDHATGLSRGYCLLRKAADAIISISPAQLSLAFPALPRSLALVKRRTCALMCATASADISPDCVSLWDSLAEIIAQSVIALTAAWQQQQALIPAFLRGVGASSDRDGCHCPAATVGPGAWTMLRRGIEQSPVFSLCSDHVQRIRAAAMTENQPLGGAVVSSTAAAATTAAACCKASAHAAAALRPAHQLALFVLSWPYGSGWHATTMTAAKERPCCEADAAVKASAVENHAKDLVAAQGNPMLSSVVDQLRALIALLADGRSGQQQQHVCSILAPAAQCTESSPSCPGRALLPPAGLCCASCCTAASESSLACAVPV